MKVAVIGVGISGLTTSLLFAQRGHSVKIISELPLSQSTSYVAGALWYPSKLEPQDLVRTWALSSLRHFKRLSEIPETGVRIMPIQRWFHRRMGKPWWAGEVEGFKLLYSKDCPGARCGYFFHAPVIDMPRYLDWLKKQNESLGVKFTNGKIETLAEIQGDYDVCINCTGFGSKDLCLDLDLRAVRGISVVGKSEFDLKQAFLDWDDTNGITYIVPRVSEVVLGGSEEILPYGDVSTTADQIRKRCELKEPILKSLSQVEIKVGYRPVRTKVRVERDLVHPKWIHNYGHGGNGVTLSWGSAEYVFRLS